MITDEIKHKIEQALPGARVDITNKSSQHIGHDAGGAHLGVTVKYTGFKGKTMVEQHQMIYAILKEEMKQKIHALVIKTEILQGV
ncbi:MAG: BolA family protein [Nanoarchaeota archaeon]|nr:BolA family protein [Nanoarchaeota archaeon]